MYLTQKEALSLKEERLMNKTCMKNLRRLLFPCSKGRTTIEGRDAMQYKEAVLLEVGMLGNHKKCVTIWKKRAGQRTP
jgi:hypothetical protein